MRPTTGICTDGWASGNPGIGGSIVSDLSGRVLATRDSEVALTNNMYELRGIALAIHYILRNKLVGQIDTIWTDSVTALSWATKGKFGKSVTNKEQLLPIVDYIQDRCKWYRIKIQKWDTNSWGTIPSDPGRK